MVVGTLMNPWLIGSERVTFIRFNLWIDTKQQVKLEMQEQHKTLCYEYNNATLLEEANACYATIHS
jgi:hypothetical protein